MRGHESKEHKELIKQKGLYAKLQVECAEEQKKVATYQSKMVEMKKENENAKKMLIEEKERSKCLEQKLREGNNSIKEVVETLSELVLE